MAKSSFATQANALFLKNITYQERNPKENLRLIMFPFVLSLLVLLFNASMKLKNDVSNKQNPQNAIPQNPILSTMRAPPVEKLLPYLHVPHHEFRAVRTESIPYEDLPDESCRANGFCPVTILVTGQNEFLGKSVGMNLITASASLNFSQFSPPGDYDADQTPNHMNDLLVGEPQHHPNHNGRFVPPTSVVIQDQCKHKDIVAIEVKSEAGILGMDVECGRGLSLWRNSSSLINDEIFKGYRGGNPKNEVNEILTAYDFLNTDQTNFNVNIWYNSTNDESKTSSLLRTVNMASNAYLKFLNGTGIKVLLDFLGGMPERGQDLRSHEEGMYYFFLPLLVTWLILQLFPVIVATLVYEKQHNLRIMMKMHGLGDGPYWMITYLYFLVLSSAYMLCLLASGTIIGLSMLEQTELSIQFVFYIIFINVQISFGFLFATLFSHVKTATVMSHMYVFGSGLLAKFVFENLLKSSSFPRSSIVLLELFPPFALYRGLFEFEDYAKRTSYVGYPVKMSWNDVNNDGQNGIKELLTLMIVEWFIIIFVAYYLDQVVSLGSGVRKHPLFFLKKPSPSYQQPTIQEQQPNIHAEIDKPDVSQEREKVTELIQRNDTTHSIICDQLRKVYPAKDGNPEKLAVRGLSLALAPGECFGMLGPNGAGKTSFISMMIGLTTPTSGVALVNGFDIKTEMDEIYSSMGVCPQHDLLWECLTAREHLLFYGRLKNLKDSALTEAVEESLKSVNLYHGGIADRQAGTYSGGMKRRLSVAISLIGDPKVVYMDEPSTGLDPASRNQLWNIVKRAKNGRAIILTTHSMEEAEALCDRLGIFANGSLQCIGNAKELKARYGGSYVLTMTTSVSLEDEVENLVRQLSSNANKVYHLSGTQTFEIPKEDVRIGDVFRAVENAKKRFTINAWALTDTTLEDVFIKVAKAALASTSTM